MMMKRLLVLVAALLFILLWAVVAVYPNWLWFQNLNYASVFWTMILGKFGLASAIWLVLIIILFPEILIQ